MNRVALGLLILCNIVWALNPLMGKTLLEAYPGVEVAWLRYASGFAAFLVFALADIFFRGTPPRRYFLVPRDFGVGRDLAILGIAPFALAPILQFVGLESSQAMENSVLIATEPLIAVTLARLVLGERMNRDHATAMVLALVGFLFFSGVFSGGFGIVRLGMLYLLLAQVGEGAYSVFSRKLTKDHDPLAVFGTALAVGTVVLTIVVVGSVGLPAFGEMNLSRTGALVWLGPIGSTLTYLIWAAVTKRVTVASMALTLFIQPIVGAFAGYFFLGESLGVERLCGALLILVAIAYLSFRELRSENRTPG